MREENQRMKGFLNKNGIIATPKYIRKGSLGGCWRIHSLKRHGTYEIWTLALALRFTELGFVGFDGQKLDKYSGNGGLFSVFVRGHAELF